MLKDILDLIKISLFKGNNKIFSNDKNLEKIFNLSKKHVISNIVYDGLKKADVSIPEDIEVRFKREEDKAIFQYIKQNSELLNICNALEKNKIPHIVLKGSRLRNFYPSPELRTSCDIDILFKGEDEQIMQIMSSLSYEFHKDGGTTLNFTKGVAVEVEMHRYLFDDKLSFKNYFESVWDRAVLAENKQFEYLLTEEDFYAYMIAHAAKHFSRYGSGIRTVLDIPVYNSNTPQNFDRKKAEAILSDIGLLGFEKRLVSLCDAWFSKDELSEEDLKLTDYIAGAGIYGNGKITNAINIANAENVSAEKAKRKLNFIFPSFSIMCGQYPVLKKLPFLLPFFWIVRFFRVFTNKRKKAFNDFSVLNSIDNNYLDYMDKIMDNLKLK